MTRTALDLHLPAASAAADPYTVDVDPARAGWTYCGLRVAEIAPGHATGLHTGDSELVVVPLAGAATVTVDGHPYELHGRPSVFTAVTDALYVPRDSEVLLASEQGGRFALPGARCEQRFPVTYLPAQDVPVELRGAGQSSRQVNNLAMPDRLDADRLIVCEVLTPGGNWSSWPPHKHDEERDGESVLEEIYYFEVAPGPGAGLESRAFGVQRVYGHERADVDVLAEVRTGDVVLVPHGWHGPSMAAPGYDLYYLNVMAGPGERAWAVCDDPAHTWVRSTWSDQPVDPRLPLTGSRVPS